MEGQFDNKNSKKGRKKNYDDFFEKTYLNKFLEANNSQISNSNSHKKIKKVTVYSPVNDNSAKIFMLADTQTKSKQNIFNNFGTRVNLSSFKFSCLT